VSAVPRRLLRESVSVQTKSGEGAYGPIVAEAATVACKASWRRQLVRDANGEEVVSELTLHVHPDDEARFTPGSALTYEGYATTVLSVAPERRPSETVVVRVTCR